MWNLALTRITNEPWRLGGLNMFSIFSNIKIISIIIIIVFIGSLYTYNVYLRNENEELTIKNTKLNEDLKQTKIDIEDIKKININLYNNNIKLKNESSDLNKKLSKLSNIDKIAQKHPKMLGNILTNASKEVNRCFENITRGEECKP